MKKSLLCLLTLLCFCSAAFAESDSKGHLKQWDNEFSQAMDGLETVKTPEVPDSAMSSMPLGTLHDTDEKQLDNRDDLDAKARMARLENKIVELEREQRNMSDRLRNLDRQVNDLKRKV